MLVTAATSRPASTRPSIVRSTSAVAGHVSASQRSSLRGTGTGCCHAAGAGCASARRLETLGDFVTGSARPETTRGSANVRGSVSGSGSENASVSRRCLGRGGGGKTRPRPATHTTTPLYVLFRWGFGDASSSGGCRGVGASRVTCPGASGDLPVEEPHASATVRLRRSVAGGDCSGGFGVWIENERRQRRLCCSRSDSTRGYSVPT